MNFILRCKYQQEDLILLAIENRAVMHHSDKENTNTSKLNILTQYPNNSVKCQVLEKTVILKQRQKKPAKKLPIYTFFILFLKAM